MNVADTKMCVCMLHYTVDSVQIASHKIIFVFMQKFSMFLNSIKLHLVLSVTTRHRAF